MTTIGDMHGVMDDMASKLSMPATEDIDSNSVISSIYDGVLKFAHDHPEKIRDLSKK